MPESVTVTQYMCHGLLAVRSSSHSTDPLILRSIHYNQYIKSIRIVFCHIFCSYTYIFFHTTTQPEGCGTHFLLIVKTPVPRMAIRTGGILSP
jgi:hypothetical protein